MKIVIHLKSLTQLFYLLDTNTAFIFFRSYFCSRVQSFQAMCFCKMLVISVKMLNCIDYFGGFCLLNVSILSFRQSISYLYVARAI